jgi:enoyl-CoA hydratase/carnithine racemase
MPIADVNQDTSVHTAPGGLMACHLDGPVAVVTMNHRPYNLMGREFTEQLIDALRWVGKSGARAAILRSGLRHFSAGADLDGMLEAVGDGEGTLEIECRSLPMTMTRAARQWASAWKTVCCPGVTPT